MHDNEMFQLDMEIIVAHGEVIPCVDGILLKLSLPGGSGGWKETWQLNYVVRNIVGLIVGLVYVI